MTPSEHDPQHPSDAQHEEGHASTGGAAAAGAVTGGTIGLVGGPLGAAAGAVGGAIVGAAAELLMHGGKHPDASSSESAPDASGDHRRVRQSDGPEKIQLREEELVVQRKPVRTGEVVIHKEVVTESRTIEVPLARENLVIGQVSVEPRPAEELEGSGLSSLEQLIARGLRDLRPGEELRIPVIEEEVVVVRRPVITEEIVIRKRVTESTEEVTSDVRREELRVESTGDVTVLGRGAGNQVPPPPADRPVRE